MTSKAELLPSIIWSDVTYDVTYMMSVKNQAYSSLETQNSTEGLFVWRVVISADSVLDSSDVELVRRSAWAIQSLDAGKQAEVFTPGDNFSNEILNVLVALST